MIGPELAPAIRDLLAGFEGPSVTLRCRARLSDEVVELVEHWVSREAGRQVSVEVRVNPSMDAGAILLVGDSGRVVLDPRVAWVDGVQRDTETRMRAGELPELDEVFEHLRAGLTATEIEPTVDLLGDEGTVVRMADGVVAIAGLRGVGSHELIEFDSGIQGLAFSVAEEHVGCVLLGDDAEIREGSRARRTGGSVHVPAGPALRGRVVDPLGRPLDDGGPIPVVRWMPAEAPAPGVIDRQSVVSPLHTGMKIVDALVPIGRGQRELVLGDRKIGKTTLGVDAILAQKDTGVTCVYCAIGQKSTSVGQVVSTLAEHGALSYTIIVAALPADPPALRYLAPFAACAMAEYVRDSGGDALVVYDDLTKHAVTYREISALLDRPIGREAYPGDIFYLHARLLERAARMSAENGGGSLTAIPIIETLSGDLSSFIPTNVISICDGQIVLDAAAFNSGRRPAMDVGLSVSRVGGAAQGTVMRRTAGRLRIDLAQYEEMAKFVKFGAELDEATRGQLTRGERARELLTQEPHRPMPLGEELLILHAAVSGAFDDTPVAELTDAEEGLLRWARSERAGLLGQLATAEELSAELSASLDEALTTFVSARVSSSEGAGARQVAEPGEADRPVEAATT